MSHRQKVAPYLNRTEIGTYFHARQPYKGFDFAKLSPSSNLLTNICRSTLVKLKTVDLIFFKWKTTSWKIATMQDDIDCWKLAKLDHVQPHWPAVLSQGSHF